MLRNSVATESIYGFARVTQQADVSPEEPIQILEIPVSEFQGLLNELTTTYNLVAEMVRDSAILRGRELARMTTEASNSIKATGSPIDKVLLLNAHTRRLLAKVREALKTRPSPDSGKVIQVCTKIMARAVQIIDYVKTVIQEDPLRRKEISFDSQQARILFSGAGDETVSRKETIRAMQRAEKLWPALNCGHRLNDGRQTTRLTAKTEDLQDMLIIDYRDLWQRSDRSIALGL
jgi:hypothetical protein